MKRIDIKCGKCNGTGYLEMFNYYAEGACFDCKGSGVVGSATAKVQAKYQAELERMALDAEKDEVKRQEKQYEENMVIFHREINNLSEADTNFLDMVNDASKVLMPDNPSENEVRKFINDYFGRDEHIRRFALSKWTLGNFGFIFMEICGEYEICVY